MESMEKGLKLFVLKLTFNVCLKVGNIHLKITKMVIQTAVLLKSISYQKKFESSSNYVLL